MFFLYSYFFIFIETNFNVIATLLTAQVFAIALSVFSFWRKSVSVSGFLSMLIVSSYMIWNQGIAPLVILFSMFASSSLLTKYKHDYKYSLVGKVLKKQGPRDYIQAISNLGVAFSCFVFYSFTADQVYLLSLLCSVASSNADSWASEIGVLSKKNPVLITTFRQCRPGISGGITLLGTTAGIVGSVFIALVAVLLKENIGMTGSAMNLFLWISISGIAGLFIDSLLGATVQIVYTDRDEETENPGEGNQNIRSRGIKKINNDVVNFLSSFLIAFMVFLLGRLF